jgi:hypothetical protein
MELLAMAFDSTCSFDFKRCLFKFEGREFALHSGDDNYCEVVQTILQDSSERDSAFGMINRFLHRYGWENGCSFQFRNIVSQWFSKTDLGLLEISPILRARRHYHNVAVTFDHVAAPSSHAVDVALSLYNDARYSTDFFYRFLCYWKILSIPDDHRSRKPAEWINNLIASDTERPSTSSLEELLAKKIDVGEFFQAKCRNAIAHIERRPTVLPFRWDDYRQIENACFAIEPFVVYFIQRELHVPKHPDQVEVVRTT